MSAECIRDPESLTFHRALTTYYGSLLHQDLNQLSGLLRKLAVLSCGLEFMLQCRHHRIMLKFATNAVNFAHNGAHLSRLVGKLPGRILRAAIRDNWLHRAEIQYSVDRCWMRLDNVVKNNRHWNELVLLKDAFYSRAIKQCSRHLRWKFNALWHVHLDTSYANLSDNGTTAALRSTPTPVSPDRLSSSAYFSCRSTRSVLSAPTVVSEPDPSQSGLFASPTDLGSDSSWWCRSVVSPPELGVESPWWRRSVASPLDFGAESPWWRHSASLQDVNSSGSDKSVRSVRAMAELDLHNQAFLGSDRSDQMGFQEAIQDSNLSNFSLASVPHEPSVPVQPVLADRSFILPDPSRPIPLPDVPVVADVDVDRSLLAMRWGDNVPVLVRDDVRLKSQVVNLSGLVMTTHQKELLALGLGFRVTPRHVP